MAMHFDDRIRGCTACGRQFTRRTNSRAEVTCGNCKKTQAFQGTAPAEDAEAQSDQHTEANGMDTDWIVEWRHTPQWVNHPVHIENWDRILVAVGRGAESATVTADTRPMTMEEALERMQMGWDHYDRVFAILGELGRAGKLPPDSAEVVVVEGPELAPDPENNDDEPFRPWSETRAHASAVKDFLAKCKEDPVWPLIVEEGSWLVEDDKRSIEEMASDWHWSDPLPELSMYEGEFGFYKQKLDVKLRERALLAWFPPIEQVRRRMTLPPHIGERYERDEDMPARWVTPEAFKDKGKSWRESEYEYWEGAQATWGWRPILEWLVNDSMPTQQEIIDRIAKLPAFTEDDLRARVQEAANEEEKQYILGWIGWSKPQVGDVFDSNFDKLVYLRDERDSSLQEGWEPFQQGGRQVVRTSYDNWTISATHPFGEWYLERQQPWHHWYIKRGGVGNAQDSIVFGNHPDEEPWAHNSPTAIGDFGFVDWMMYGTGQGGNPLHAIGPATAIDCAIRYIELVEWAYGALETKPAWITWVPEA